MKIAEKVALGISMALVLSCTGSILVLLFTDFGPDFIRPASQTVAASRRVSALARKYPFRPPADGILPGGRLDAYLRVCTAVKGSSDALDAWLMVHRGGVGPVRVAGLPYLRGEGASLATAFFGDLAESLDAETMCFGEFLWIRNRLQYLSSPPDPKREEEIRREVQQLKELASRPETPPEARESLAGHIALLEALPWSTGPSAEANRNLFIRNEGRIQSNRLSDRVVELASDFSVSGPGETRTIVFEGETEGHAPP